MTEKYSSRFITSKWHFVFNWWASVIIRTLGFLCTYSYWNRQLEFDLVVTGYICFNCLVFFSGGLYFVAVILYVLLQKNCLNPWLQYIIHTHAVSWSLVYQAYHTKLCISEAIIDSLHSYSIVATLLNVDGTDCDCDVQFAEDGTQAGMK